MRTTLSWPRNAWRRRNTGPSKRIGGIKRGPNCAQKRSTIMGKIGKSKRHPRRGPGGVSRNIPPPWPGGGTGSGRPRRGAVRGRPWPGASGSGKGAAQEKVHEQRRGPRKKKKEGQKPARFSQRGPRPTCGLAFHQSGEGPGSSSHFDAGRPYHPGEKTDLENSRKRGKKT